MKRATRVQGELLKGSTPTLILAVLVEAPQHGYAVAREIERRSEQALSLGEGSLYPTLRLLEADGLVTSAWEPRPSGPARKVYSLTDAGRKELAARTASWRDFVRAIEGVISGESHEPQTT